MWLFLQLQNSIIAKIKYPLIYFVSQTFFCEQVHVEAHLFLSV